MLDHVIQKISKSQIKTDPFPYFFTKEIFPDDYYQEILDYLPAREDYQPLSASGVVRQGTYKQRLCLPLVAESISDLPFMHMIFWSRFIELMKSDQFVSAVLDLFRPQIEERFGNQKVRLQPDLGLISDNSDYAIGPHTDHPQKVLTLLFYFPRNDKQKSLGTSVYKPKDSAFRCEGFKHHPFEGFERTYTAPFIPNSVFGFFKSDRSFHGVEPIGTQATPRNLLSYQFLWEACHS